MPRTLEELAGLLEQSAGESAKTNAKIDNEVMPRLDTLEGSFIDLKATVKESGLNGHTALLKKFLDEYAAGQSKEQAWAIVRADLKHWFGFLAQPRAWLRTIFYATLGGIGWELVSSIAAHPPHWLSSL